MKKLIIIVSLLFCLVVPADAYDLPENVKDANTLHIHMRQNFYYAHDRVIPQYDEYFQAPVILEFTRVGDCDDFAIYSSYYLLKMGYQVQPYVLILQDGNEFVGHAITVFYEESNNTYSVFSNQYLFKTLKTDPIEAIKDIYPTWTIIYQWNFSKIGYLTFKEVYADCDPVAFVDLETKIRYYIETIKEKVLDYVD